MLLRKLYCWRFEYKSSRFPTSLSICHTGVCAYTLAEAREYFIERLKHEGEEALIPSVEFMEPKMFDDTEDMKPGWK